MGQGYIYDTESAPNDHTSVLGLVTGGNYSIGLDRSATITSKDGTEWRFEYNKKGRVEVICQEAGRDMPEIYFVHPAALFTMGFEDLAPNSIPLISQNSGEQIILKLNRPLQEIESVEKSYVII